MTDMARLAEEAGAQDMFVLHRIAPDQLVNLGGHGRGSGWAGNVCVDPTLEPWLTTVLTEGSAKHTSPVPSNLFGPYWASDAVGHVVGSYVVVVCGDGVSEVDAAVLERAAQAAATSVGEVPVHKRLADDLEVAQAALEIAMMRPDTVEQAASLIAGAAARALSCEFGAVLMLRDHPDVWTADEGWRAIGTDEEIAGALLPLAAAARPDTPLVEQDLRQSPNAYPPLSYEDGLVSRCSVRLEGRGWTGLLVTAHAGTAARGFTDLCQRVAVAMAQAACVALDAAYLRDHA